MNQAYREFYTADRLLDLITRERLVESLRLSAVWLGEARTAARGRGVGYRDIAYFKDGQFKWMFPHSNAGEQINVFLFLHDALGDAQCLQHAIEYADLVIADPIRGIYRGEHREAHGLPWYWTDIGVYTGIYGMRLPAGFYALFDRTGKASYEEYARLTGEPLVTRQTGSGLIDAGWSPKNGWAEAKHRTGVRIGYAMGTLALMHHRTREQRYADALDRLIGVFQRMQNPDGSFYESYDTETAEPVARSVKNHFFGYILNGMTDAYRLMPDERLLAMAKKLAEFVARNFYYRQVVPYCAGPEEHPANKLEQESPVNDPVAGLLKLHRITREPHYLDIALKLWWHYYTWQVRCPHRPELHGAIVQGANPDGGKFGTSSTVEGREAGPGEQVGHCCIYYHNQFVLASEQLLPLTTA